MPRKKVKYVPSKEELAERARQKAEQARQAASARRKKQFESANVIYDERLATTQREIGLGKDPMTQQKRASLNDPGTLIKRVSDRTDARLKAIVAFDDLCHRAYAGLFPEPKFERGVDVSHSPAGVPNDRADALQHMQRLTAYIGDELQAILHLRIFERQTYARMSDQGVGDERSISAMFIAGIDGVARFYGLSGPSRASEARERTLSHV